MNKDDTVKRLKEVHGLVMLTSLGLSAAIHLITRGDRPAWEKENATLQEAVHYYHAEAKAAEAVIRDLRVNLMDVDKRRGRAVADSQRRAEQEERDGGLLIAMADALPVGALFGSEHTGQWEKTADTPQAEFGPADIHNRHQGRKPIWGLRRMMHQGTHIDQPETLNEALGNTSGAFQKFTRAVDPRRTDGQ